MFSRKANDTGDTSKFTGYFLALSFIVLTIKLTTLYFVNPTLTAKEIIISSASLYYIDCDILLRLQTTICYVISAFIAFWTLRKNNILSITTASFILLWPSATYSGLFIIEPTSAAHLSAFLLAPFSGFIVSKYNLVKTSKFTLSSLFVSLLFFSLGSHYFYKNNNESLENFDFMLDNKVANHFVEGVKAYLNFGAEKKIYIEEYNNFLTTSRYIKNAEIVHSIDIKPDSNSLYIASSRSSENDLMQKFGMNFEYSGIIDFEPYTNVRFISTVYIVSEIKAEEKPENAE